MLYDKSTINREMLKQLNSQKHNRNKKAQLAVAREDALRLYMQVLLQY